MKTLLTLATIFCLITGVALQNTAYAQCDNIASTCSANMSKLFVSDGQLYRALLNGDEIAEFSNVFYGGATYRIAACSALTDGNLLFTIYDKENNVLFSNASQNNAPYWDFSFKSTMTCRIEAQLNRVNLNSGCAVLLIGYR